MRVEIDIKLDRVAGLLCCALEGGSNYWYCIDYDKSTKPPAINPELGGDWDGFRHIYWPLSGGGALFIGDIEDEDEGAILDLGSVERGLRVMLEKYPRHFGDFISENEDAETGDVFLQCSLFGKIQYG
jgi:hypothetical protein